MTTYTIDAANERLLDLRGLVKWMEQRTGRRTHINGARRWLRTGIRGIRLPSIMLAGIRYTSAEALAWWIAATSQACEPDSAAAAPAVGGVTPHQRKVLERAGVLEPEGS